MCHPLLLELKLFIFFATSPGVLGLRLPLLLLQKEKGGGGGMQRGVREANKVTEVTEVTGKGPSPPSAWQRAPPPCH